FDRSFVDSIFAAFREDLAPMVENSSKFVDALGVLPQVCGEESGFAGANRDSLDVDSFAMKATPVTNAEWGAFATSLGKDRFVLLDHDWETGETKLAKTGQTIEEVMGSPVTTTEGITFDQGKVMIFGSAILLKITDNPSTLFDTPAQSGKPARIFSSAEQP